MPRFETTKLDHDLLYDRWITFGAWLRQRRRIAGLTQAETALAVGVSRRQWILYEHGSKMLRKRFKAAAPILNVPLETMLNRAAYKVSPRLNDIKGHLGTIEDHLSAGKTYLAVLELLRLNDRIAAKKQLVKRIGLGPQATEFAQAVAAVGRLPPELFNLLLNAMQGRTKDKKKEPKMDPRDRNRLRAKCIEALQSNRVSSR